MDSKPQETSELCSCARSNLAGASSCSTNSLESLCTMTCERSTERKAQLNCSSVVRRVSALLLLQQSMGDVQAILSGLKCSASPSSWSVNGLSWSSRRATTNGKPKSRAIWRELAGTQPELSLRLATLVRLISAGECSFLPTPVSRDSRSPGRPSHPRLTGTRGQPLPETLGTRLHPEVCEWLMGLPVGWTEMLPSRQLEIPIRQEWQPSSVEQSCA